MGNGDAPDWPVGNSELAQRVRSFAWTDGPLGAIGDWPQSLRTTVDLLLPNGFPMIALWGPDLVQIYNDGYSAIMGNKHPRGLGQPTSECWPEVWHINKPVYERVLAGESIMFADALYPISRSGRLEDAWFTLAYSPLRGEQGAIVGVLVTVVETTERMLALKHQETAEALLSEARERSRQPLEGVSQSTWEMDAAGAVQEGSPSWRTYTGQDTGTEVGNGWLAAIHGDDRARVAAHRDGAIRDRGVVDMDFRLWHAASDDWRWANLRAAPQIDAEGTLLRWIGTSIDIHARKIAEMALAERNEALRDREERLHLLVAELQHRVRNILTVVRSVFSRSAEASDDLESLVDHYDGRLAALARTQVTVTQGEQGTADLENIVRDELLSVAVVDGPRVVIDGPDVLLPSKIAELLGLAVHELATNAVKYGAFKIPDGRLDVTWRLADDRTLDFRWRERGVPTVAVGSLREGFGRELLEKVLPYQLGATTVFDLRGGGLSCEITLRLPDHVEWVGA